MADRETLSTQIFNSRQLEPYLHREDWTKNKN